MNRNQRIQSLVDCFVVPKHKTRRAAFKYFFSILSAIEEIAVLAAERGAGIEGQLEDEIVHRETFKILAAKCGGYEEPDDNVQELIDYLQNLQGEKCMAALNVVAEGWLGCVFESVSYLCPELFESIGQDEARHNGYALSYKIPDSHELEPIISDLEYMLLGIANSPNFILPITYLIGLRNIGLMGINISKSHRKACDHLNIKSDTREYELVAKRSFKASSNIPEEIEINQWQLNKINLWDRPQEIVHTKEIKINVKNELRVQAKVIRALYEIMSIEPRFRNVVRDNKVYRTKRMMIGVRVPWDEGMITTVFIDAKNCYEKILRRLITKIKRKKEKSYDVIPPIHHLKQFLPPSQCAINLSYIGQYGARWGQCKLCEVEGASTSIYIGAPENNKYAISIVMDHRIFDGNDAALLSHLLQKFLEKDN